MNYQESLAVPMTGCCLEVSDAMGLASFSESSVQMVTWARSVEPDAVRFAQEALIKQPFEMRELLGAEEVASFDPVPAFAREAAPELADRFAEDVTFMLGLFFELTSAQTVGLRLGRHHRTMCPRFHTDFIPLRLLLTYCGTGTEWLADEDVDRRFLGSGNGGKPDHESGLMLPGATVRHVPALTVALLKGAAWPGNAEKGAIHRSPSLAGDERRVLLSLDIID